LYKNPQCSCCEAYATYLRKNGFDVDEKPTNDLSEINRKAGVPKEFQGSKNGLVLNSAVYDVTATSSAA
jgi:hypothetical protein